MKKTFTTLLFCFTAIAAFSQTAITLTQATCPLPPDSSIVLDVTSQVTGIPSVSNNATWNYSGISLTSAVPGYAIFTPVSGDPNFPTAQFKRTFFKGLTSSLGYYMDQYYEIKASGAVALGLHVYAQNYGLGALTGTTTDSLYILDNVITYSGSRNIIEFPATAGSAWSNTERCLVNMQLTVASASLNRTPMQQAFYYHRVDSVKGWGTLELPAQTGYNSNVPVLADFNREYCVDSFYLGGSPAPGSITSAFGITQGQYTAPIAYRLYMYRQGLFYYQMQFYYNDSTFSSLASSGGAYLNAALPVSTGIADLSGSNEAVIYPNPVSGKLFYIQTTSAGNIAGLELYDLSGRKLSPISLVSKGNITEVNTGSPLTEGIYFYSATDADGSVLAHGKLSVR